MSDLDVNDKNRIDELVTNHEAFNKFVYFNLTDAVKEHEKRAQDTSLDEKIKNLLGGDVPEIFLDTGKKIVVFRHIATPNYEIRRFISIADAVQDFDPVILEYTHDKFTNRNEWKYSLGKINFFKGVNKLNEQLFESRVVVDFNTSNGSPIKDIKTLWDQSLVDFHHDFFFDIYPNLKNNVSDISEWIIKNGTQAKEYYKFFFLIFIKHGILLENFLLTGKELEFTKEVILPALFEIERDLGLRPLIVALEPTDIEDSKFWLAHPHEHISVANKLL